MLSARPMKYFIHTPQPILHHRLQNKYKTVNNGPRINLNEESLT